MTDDLLTSNARTVRSRRDVAQATGGGMMGNFDNNLPEFSRDFELPPDLDPMIADAVKVLYSNGIETYESCQGGPGHAYPEPTIRFHGQRGDGFRALSIALDHGLDVKAVKRIWVILEGEPVGPQWEMTLWPAADKEESTP